MPLQFAFDLVEVAGSATDEERWPQSFKELQPFGLSNPQSIRGRPAITQRTTFYL